MRIIDWSSDVCSSDLRDTAGIAAPSAPAAPTCRLQWGRRRGCGRHRRHEATSGKGWSLRSLHGARGADRNADRKSVVSGKRVSVRVEPGGCRIIQKKKRKNTK